ncbi:MAG TPA: hypothetical protein ENN08_04740, partial [Bacteroidales bacterium]|nr:hypothetical protein [Bacteroidales bacterium]
CVQDENAIIYVFDIAEGKVVSQYHFGRDGDYEGIAMNGDTAFVLRSDGKIFHVKDFRSEDKTLKRIDTPLTATNNAEGLFYDSKTNRLLIACKNRAGISSTKPLQGHKAVYSYDLNRQQFIKEPTWLISLYELEKFADYSPYEAFSVKLGRRLGFLSGDVFFKPSGIAIHPLTDEVYIIAHIGKKLLVMNREGEIRHLIQLDPQQFKQPEGITFSPQGDLYISNEGGGSKANIIRFNMINN